jgi:hypothetical protein
VIHRRDELVDDGVAMDGYMYSVETGLMIARVEIASNWDRRLILRLHRRSIDGPAYALVKLPLGMDGCVPRRW